jgi:hypothetical protein
MTDPRGEFNLANGRFEGEEMNSEPQSPWNAPAKFVMWALMEGPWQGADVDGAAAQDKAVELGLITATTYDPAKHGESDCADPGDQWFVPSESLLAALSVKPGAEPDRQATAALIREYLQKKYGTAAVQVSSDGMERIYYNGIPLLDLADALSVSRPHHHTGSSALSAPDASAPAQRPRE